MFLRENYWRDGIPVYEVKELSMEEALLVFAAEKEALSREAKERSRPHGSSAQTSSGDTAQVA